MDRQTDRPERASTTTGVDVSADRESTAAEVLEWRRDDVFLPEAQATTEEFPSLRNISAGFIFGGVVRPLEPAPPEYVTLSMRPASDREFVRLQWNMLWESAQFRRRFFDMDDLRADGEDRRPWRHQRHFVPRTRARYFEYAPLFHLLPKRVLDLFGPPLLRGGRWPFMADWRASTISCHPTSRPGLPAPGCQRCGRT